jgi:RND superfamily putative drug exporter
MTAPKRRKPFLFTIVGLVVWFGLSGVLGPVSGKLAEVQTNTNSEFLPVNAETTKAQVLLEKFSQSGNGDVLPMTIAFERTNGTFSAADAPAFQKITADILALSSVKEYVATIETPLGEFPSVFPATPEQFPLALSKDAEAFVLNINLDSNKLISGQGAFETIGEIATDVQKIVDESDIVSAKGYVTGAVGIFAELAAAFGGIDTALLITTLLAVALILIVVYRSPYLWLIPLMSAVFSLTLASGAVYYLAKNDIIKLNGQSQGILSVLVLGASTDYALLLVSRFREELRHDEDKYHAMWAAIKGTWEPITASAGTVAVGLMCLQLSELKSNAGLGPVGAVGVAAALIVTMTFLPLLLLIPSVLAPFYSILAGLIVVGIPVGIAHLLNDSIDLGLITKIGLPLGFAFFIGLIVARIFVLIRKKHWFFESGRWIFWPFVPKFGSEVVETKGIWGKVATGVGKRSRLSWVLTTAGLLIMAFGVTTLEANGISDIDSFTNKDAKALVGLRVLTDHDLVPPSSDATIVFKADSVDAVKAAAQSSEGVSLVAVREAVIGSGQPIVVDGYSAMDVTFKATEEAVVQQTQVANLRSAVHAVDGAEALVGGSAAANYDVQESSRRDRIVIIPVILFVITLILMLLLRSILAPILLIGTVVLSFAATLGASAFVFNHIFDFPGADASFPLFAFVFLVALGIDYNIFLMTRVREETLKIGTRAGTLKALAVTGGVITSAGVVLAATFAALGILPLVFLAELGFTVAFGVLLDTIIVRSILVPALSYDIGKKIWWPSKLAKADEPVN